MQTVSSFLRRKDRVSGPVIALPMPNTLIGIEVEIDRESGAPSTVFPSDYSPEWERKRDGSLHNGYEFVLKAPLKGQQLVDSIYKLYNEPTKANRTYTGSTHIHVDMMDGVDIDALRTLALMTYALESVLYAAGDMSRQWCGFANRLSSAPSEVVEGIMAIKSYTSFINATSVSRYYGLNLQALTKYGSVEFRYFPTAESADELVRWVKLVQIFKKAALEIGTTDKLIALLTTEEGYNSFLATYFSEYSAEVEASGGYEKVRALMQKALIISKTEGRKHKNRQYKETLLTGRYKNVVARAKRKTKKKVLTNVKLHIVDSMSTNAGAPTSGIAVQEYMREHNEAPELTLLIHSTGMVYYVKSYSDQADHCEWTYLNDLGHNHPEKIDMALACEAAIRQYIDEKIAPNWPSVANACHTRLNTALEQLRLWGQDVGPTPAYSTSSEDNYDEDRAVVDSEEYDESEEEF